MADSQDTYIHFFVDKYNKVVINNINNSEKELREIYKIDKSNPLLMFSYNFNSHKLHVKNISDAILGYLLSFKKQDKSPTGFEKEALSQLDVVTAFLQKEYQWPGDITTEQIATNKEALELQLKDFKIAYKFISLILDSFNFEVVNLNIAIIDDLSSDSDFIHDGESVKRNGHIMKGPAILIRKNNSTFLTNRNLVFQYFFNLNKLYNLNIASDEFYYDCIGSYIEEMFHLFLETGNISNISYWHVYTKAGNVYLDNKKSKISNDEKKDTDIHSVGFTFSFVDGEDSNYLIFDDLDIDSVKNTHVYHEMYDFLLDNADKFGHVDADGEKITDDPVVIFLKQKSNVTTYMATELPMWVYIKNILSPMYGFEPKDILVLKGNFDFSFSSKYINEPTDQIVDLLSDYVDIEFVHFPLIVINDANADRTTYSYHNHSFINDYLKYISDVNGMEIDYYYLNSNDMYEYLDNFINKVLYDKSKRIGLENEIIINLETSKHHHDYNVFKYIFDVLGFEEDRISRALLVSSEEEADKLSGKADELLQKLYYIALKAVAIIFKTKYGHSMEQDFELESGDIGAMSDYSGNIVHVLSKNMKGKKIVYECQDSITGKMLKIPHGKIIKFNLGVCDVKVYNRVKTASRDEEVHFYKNFLKTWLKNEPRKSPLDKEEEKEVVKNLGYEALLRHQSEYYDWTEGSVIIESLLGEDRKAD